MVTAAPPRGMRIGPEGIPARTGGWQILGWVAEYLTQPDGPDAGHPFILTDEQARFVLWWYAVDEQNRFVYRSGVLRRMKGWGKDPLGAVLCAVEFVGPCRPSREDDADGNPIMVPHSAAWVQTAAVAKEQTRNTMTLFPGLFSKDAMAEFSIDLGKEIIYAHKGRCRIEAVTSSPRALEGGRATFVLMNETHHWLENNEGIAMSEVIARNAAKSRDGSSRTLQITNAHNPGENSVAEQGWEAYLKIAEGKSKATGFLYDSLEAPADTVMADRDSLTAGLLAARGDSVWLDVDRLIEEIYDPRTPPSTSRRFYLNQIVAAEDSWIAPHEWDEQAEMWQPIAGEEITLGFDGSKSDDHTALVGCHVETGHIFRIDIWDPEDYGGEAPREDIDATVHMAFARWDVVGFYSDLSPWESYVDKWSEEWGDQLCVRATQMHPIAWDFRARKAQVVKASEAFHDAITEKAMTHDGDPTARQHVLNARNRPSNVGMSFGKEHRGSPRKVDFLAAAVIARLARQDYVALPDNRKRMKRYGWVVR